jgi:outer membrane lipoprotein-sorting protein
MPVALDFLLEDFQMNIKKYYLFSTLALAALFSSSVVLAQSNTAQLLSLRQNNSSAYAQLQVTHYPAKDPKQQTVPAPIKYLVDISMKKPDVVDLLISGDKSAVMTVGSSNGKLIWKDHTTGISGSAPYNEAVDVALRVLLSNTASLKYDYSFSEFSLGKQPNQTGELFGVVLKPKHFDTQYERMLVWMNQGKVIGFEATYRDGTRTFAAVRKLNFTP